MYKVTKPFLANGENLKRGDEVNAEGWRNLDSLISQSYLEPIEIDLEEMTHKELYDLATEEDVEGRSKMNKKELIKELQGVS